MVVLKVLTKGKKQPENPQYSAIFCKNLDIRG
jgi:hypothetical protein